MPRKPRIHYPGAIHHIVVRGNNREPVFREHADKAKYLYYVEKYKQKFKLQLYAYVIMDNHAHLLGAVDREPLAKIMQGIQQSYTQYYNRKYGRAGHVFEQRYKAKLCKQDSYLLNLLRYIHQNPVKAGLTQSVKYEWSSHHAYHTSNGRLVDIIYLLSFFSNNSKTAIAKYRDFMDEKVLEDDIEKVEEVYLYDEIIIEEKQQKVTTICYEGVLEVVENTTGIAKARILREKYDRRVAEARDIFIYIVNELGIMSKSELSKMLPISLAGIIKSYTRTVDDEVLKRRADKIKNSLISQA